MRALRYLWRKHRIALLAFAAALALTLFFAARLALWALYWADPAHQMQAPQGWMTPGYVARSWHVPRGDLLDALALERGNGARPRTLAEIAAARGIPLGRMIAETEAALALIQNSRGRR